jgi:hypothetical protein
MSYLNALRLHFAGQFQANVSTVNNDPAHFDNKAFVLPDDQQLQTATAANGWFNPQGDAAFRLLGCKVTSAWTPSGQVTNDKVLQSLIADSDSRAPAKMVDLDSEQQVVSEIWGLQVRIADGQGNSLMTGDFEPMAFIDIWFRARGAQPGDDAPAGAMWQSVLTNLQWGDLGGSTFLQDLKSQADVSGLLSIKFNVDGFNLTLGDPDFMCGRIVGTIGPAASDEPHHLVVGRQFMAANVPGNRGFFRPLHGINFCAARIDTSAKSIFLDLGNALPTDTPGSAPANLGNLTLTARPAATPGHPAGAPVALGMIPATGSGGYTAPDWYLTTAGVVVLPLSDSQLQAASASPLTIAGNAQVSIAEWSSGAFVRADTFVYRMSPADKSDIDVYAMRWGKPLANAAIGFQLDPSQLQEDPPLTVATPADVLKVGSHPISTTPATVTTDGHGKATLTVTAGDPGNVRTFGGDYGIDGQVYGLRPAFTDHALNTGPVNDSNFISFLVWSGFAPGTPVTWNDLEPTLRQYANLYPVMNRFLDLGSYDDVIANAGFLQLAFGLKPDNPNVMPVTRDLSPAKRKAILSWLADPAHPRGQPVVAAAAARKAAAPSRADAKAAAGGGKAAAMARRLALQST